MPPAAPPGPAAAQVFRQAPLPYAFDALEPVIDRATMEIHYGRHHKAYYDALNTAAAGNPEVARSSVEQLLPRISQFPAVVRNNAGGVWNHDFFWKTMAPVGRGGAPSPALTARINADFGSLDQLKDQFNKAGAGRFGSGWVWLVAKDGKLVVTTTPNQDNPLMDVAETRGTPILGNDVWEHAYYLKYNNRRADYLAAWWQLVNWNEVSRRFAAAGR
jgi:Fe-Mn family superoxide dismutase